MDASIDESLAARLSASLSNSDLGPIIDAGQASALLICSQGHLERLAETGQLPGKKYGRGWIFVTAQLVHHVAIQCARNLRAPEVPLAEAQTSKSSSEVSPNLARAHSLPVLEPLKPRKRRGRPRGRWWMSLNEQE